MKKKSLVFKIILVVVVVTVLVSCFVVPSFAFVGSSGLSAQYDAFMTPIGVVTVTNDGGNTLKHFHGTNAFQPVRGIQGVDVTNGAYQYRYISNNNDGNYEFIIRPVSVPNDGVVAWQRAYYNFGSYYVNLDWCRQIGAFDTASSGITAFYSYLSPEKVLTLTSEDAWVIANEVSMSLPCYVIGSFADDVEIPRLEYKNLVITFVTRHNTIGWEEGAVRYDTNRLTGTAFSPTTVDITVDGVSVYSGNVGTSFHDVMVMDYVNHIMSHKESFGLTEYNYKFTTTTPLNWRCYGNSTLGPQNDIAYDYYKDLRFTVPQHTTPLPSQVQMTEDDGYDLAEYDVAIDPWDWLRQSASTFLSQPLFPEMVGSPTFGSLLLIFIVVPIIIAFLKLWVGG